MDEMLAKMAILNSNKEWLNLKVHLKGSNQKCKFKIHLLINYNYLLYRSRGTIIKGVPVEEDEDCYVPK